MGCSARQYELKEIYISRRETIFVFEIFFHLLIVGTFSHFSTTITTFLPDLL